MTDDDIITRLFVYEGGYVNNPNDRGGPTNFGITAATLGAWEHLARPATADEVARMPREVAAAIYRARYISGPGYDDIASWNLRMIVTDCAVLYGPGRATKWLQAAVGAAVDGALGPATLRALAAADLATVERRILTSRVNRIHDVVAAHPSQAVFCTGWMNRTHNLMQYIGGNA